MDPTPGPSKAPDATPAAAPRRRFVGRGGVAPSRAAPGTVIPSTPSQIDPSILSDPALNAAIEATLPKAYNFEVHKTIHQIRHYKSRRVALQMPEGLTMFACALVDIVEEFGGKGVEAVVMGDVTYGACCVDDYTAKALGCDFLVHYGHSCLVPVDQTSIRTLYVFVEIGIDRLHLVDTIRRNFPSCLPSFSPSSHASSRPAVDISLDDAPSSSRPIDVEEPPEVTVHLAVVGTVQFIAAVQALKQDLESTPSDAALPLDRIQRLAITTGDGKDEEIEELKLHERKRRQATKFKVLVPQVKPLSPGEILGCTAPKLPQDVDALLYVGDGRFHLESIMIANPHVPAFRYDPYERRITEEGYDHGEMKKMRAEAVAEARRTVEEAARAIARAREESGGERVNASQAMANEVKGVKAKQELGHPEPPVNGLEEGTPPEGMKRVNDDDIDNEIKPWAVVLGTLGRQGNLSVMKSVTSSLSKTALPEPAGILLSELSPAKMSLFAPQASAFVQTSCPRLSIDWGYAFPRPLLSPYEAKVALGEAEGWVGKGESGKGQKALETYPMDFYSDSSLGNWTPRHGKGVRKVGNEPGRPIPKRKTVAAAAAAAAA